MTRTSPTGRSGPLVTIGICNLDSPDTIDRCINSALRQTYPCTEVILVDDASTDGVVAHLQQHYGSQITILENAGNRGAGYSRNVILDHANGEFTAFFDSDDKAMPDRISQQIDCILTNEETSGSGVVSLANFDLFVGEHHLERTFALGEQQAAYSGSQAVALVWYVLLKHSGIRFLRSRLPVAPYDYHLGTSLMAARTSVFRAYRFDDALRRMQDLDLLLRFCEDGGTIASSGDHCVNIHAYEKGYKRWSVVLENFSTILGKHTASFAGNITRHHSLAAWLNGIMISVHRCRERFWTN
ncbi:MAG: glycosyltransferase family 2 protein [Anderseniella sp.]